MKIQYTLPLVRILELRSKGILMQSVTYTATGQSISYETESDFDEFFGI